MSNTKLIIYFIRNKKTDYYYIKILNSLWKIKENKLEIDIDKKIFSESKEKK